LARAWPAEARFETIKKGRRAERTTDRFGRTERGEFLRRRACGVEPAPRRSAKRPAVRSISGVTVTRPSSRPLDRELFGMRFWIGRRRYTIEGWMQRNPVYPIYLTRDDRESFKARVEDIPDTAS
jgi:hypothetical protein